MKQNIKSYSVIMLLILFTAFVNVKSQSVASVDSTENKSIMFMDSANDRLLRIWFISGIKFLDFSVLVFTQYIFELYLREF